MSGRPLVRGWARVVVDPFRVGRAEDSGLFRVEGLYPKRYL